MLSDFGSALAFGAASCSGCAFGAALGSVFALGVLSVCDALELGVVFFGVLSAFAGFSRDDADDLAAGAVPLCSVAAPPVFAAALPVAPL